MDELKIAELKIAFDPIKDILEIEGIKYDGDVFRKFGGIEVTPAERYLKIVRRDFDGVLVLHQGTLCAGCQAEAMR